MKKEIRIIDKEKGIIQITTLDERFYAKPLEDEITGLPIYKYYPSSSWISGYYPKGIAFYKWLADKGWDEAEALKVSAGERGSKVHQATELLESLKDGEEMKMNIKLKNSTTEEMEEVSVDEWQAIISYSKWFNETKPEALAVELTVFNEKHEYAGTIDRIFRINGQIWVVDIKTSKTIWEEQVLQLSSYSNADVDYEALKITADEWKNRKNAILQIGYRLNKNGYKFTEQEDKFDLFLTARKIWANENSESKPKQIELPLAIKLDKTKGLDSENTKVVKPVLKIKNQNARN